MVVQPAILIVLKPLGVVAMAVALPPFNVPVRMLCSFVLELIDCTA